MRVESCGKVNLTLEVYGIRADGFHDLRSIVAPLSLADTLSFAVANTGEIATDTPYGEDDLIVKAARLLRGGDAALGCRVEVEKRIPAGGGLGGGSANAATTLRALNRLWNLNKPLADLVTLAAAVGSDVPALVLAQETKAPVLMEGRGEKVATLAEAGLALDLPSRHLVLANPRVHSSTGAVYARAAVRDAPATTRVNDLQAAALALYPKIGDSLAALRDLGLADVMMTGSGATCFGFAADANQAREAAAALRAQGLWAQAADLLGV